MSSRLGFWPAVIALSLVALAAGVYSQVAGHGFVNFDDPQYVYENAHVLRGLTADGVVWAFTSGHASNWHPLTWLSHMLDVELFGVDPGWHHVTNVVLHAVDALLLFAVLWSATGRKWRSAAVAALFAVHPLHVESVAWVSERKDVLSTALWLLTTWAYVRWVRRPGRGRFAVVVTAFALGLMSKPMLVTLPLTLLLLDLWPLGRIAGGVSVSRIVPLVREKIPLFALSAASCVVTYLAQSRSGAVAAEHLLPLGTRLANAALSYVLYLAKTFWPVDLAAVYPHPGLTPGGIPVWSVAGSVVLLAAVSALAVAQWRRRPWILVGWSWYLVTLLPVIGIVHVGMAGMADRYTYVPMTGILVAVAWTLADLVEGSRAGRGALAGLAAASVLTLAVVARQQTSYWRSGLVLFQHALDVTHDNSMAWRNMGVAQLDARQLGPAITSLREATRLMPYDHQAWLDLGIAYASARDLGNAGDCFQQALRLRPEDPHVWFNVAVFDAIRGDWDGVREAHERLQRTSPEMAERLERRIMRSRPPQ
jgi:hypothetical protein